jgi:hypothetical protein
VSGTAKILLAAVVALSFRQILDIPWMWVFYAVTIAVSLLLIYVTAILFYAGSGDSM